MWHLSTVVFFCLFLLTNSQLGNYQTSHREDLVPELPHIDAFRRNSGFVTYSVNPYLQFRNYGWSKNGDSVSFHEGQVNDAFLPSPMNARQTFPSNYNTLSAVRKRKNELVKRWFFRMPTEKTAISRYQMRKFPYVNIVRLSSGCTGTLLTPYHVITAAHCVHDGARFKENIEMLKVHVPDKYGYRIHYVAKINVPVMWIQSQEGLLPEYAYDYAVLLLNLPVIGREKFMQLAIPTIRTKYSDLHFFGFFPNEARNELRESTCSAEDSRFVYGGNAVLTECDSAVGTSGAAVFAEDAMYGDKIIGILSSTLSQPNDEEFEAIMLLTLPKCLDICAMIYPDGEKYDVCKEVKRTEMEYFRVGTNRIMPFFG